LIKVPRFAEIEEYKDGEVIVQDGDEDRHMYVIQSGKVAVTKELGDREVTLAILERGSFFGEMALLESLPRTATVRAVGHAKLLVIRPGSLLMRIRRDPSLAVEMLQQMSRRVRALDSRLVALLSTVDASAHAAEEEQLYSTRTEYVRLAEGPVRDNGAAGTPRPAVPAASSSASR
jgi:CRP/FNR family transcriptional regulator, cyclic AMP receptor protein